MQLLQWCLQMRWIKDVYWHPVLVNPHLPFSPIALRPVDASPQPSGGALPSDGEFYQLSPHRCLSVHRLRRFRSWAALGGVWALCPSGGHARRDVQQRRSPVSVRERSAFQRCVSSTSLRFIALFWQLFPRVPFTLAPLTFPSPLVFFVLSHWFSKPPFIFCLILFLPELVTWGSLY